MDLSIVQLRMLCEVERRGTLAAAAEALGYTPSAVSQQLANLEKVAGTQLLERIGRNVRFTDAGRALAAHAADILERVDGAQAALEAATGEVTGTVQLAVFESIASNLLPALLTRLEADHPDLVVNTRLGGPDLAGDDLASGEVDLAFTLDYDLAPVRPERGISYDDVFDDRFFLVVPLDDPLTLATQRGKAAKLADAADRRFIGPDLSTTCGQLIETACMSSGFRPNIVHRLDDYRTAIALVENGHGVSLIPDIGLPCGLDTVRILCLDEPVSRRIQLAYRTASAQRPAIVAVRNALSELIEAQRYAADVA